jgi:hypothetical protein
MTIRAVVRNGRLETTEPLTFPEGTVVTVSTVDPHGTQELLCSWEPGLTRAEIQQRIAEGGISLAEFRKPAGVG